MTRIIKGDIANQNTEAVVNASNKELAWEDITVNGVLQCGGGRELIDELQSIHNQIGNLQTGDVVITKGYQLPYKFVLHTVGPVYPCNRLAEIELFHTYWNCYSTAYCQKIKSITFPAISTGAFRFPIESATNIAKSVFELWKHRFDEILFCCYTEADLQVYERIFGFELF